MFEIFQSWIEGRFSSAGRVWYALMPALLLTSYFFLGLLVYALRYLRRGHRRDEEIEARGSSLFAGMWLRLYFGWMMQPVVRFLIWIELPPNAITTLSVLLSSAAGVALGAGRFALGGWLYIFGGVCDYFDGRVARATGKEGPEGAALDSILDRYSDAVILMGLAWYYRDSWVLLAVLFAMMGSSIIPYIRAKGESVGVPVKIGLMQRAERIVYLAASVTLSPILEVILDPMNPKPSHRLAIVGIVLLAVSTQVTALQRLVYLLNQLRGGENDRWFERHKGVLFKNTVSAFTATGADFLTMNFLVVSVLVAPAWATLVGCLLGGIINFYMNRLWTFAIKERVLLQVGRYSFVSLTSALLNAGGVAVLLLLPSFHYTLVWILVRVAIYFTWNFPLQRDYVFAAQERSVSA
jgi:phosphatidylglycerophosphate synthase/putative flippase GtrA